MTWLRRRVRHWPLWFLIASAPGAVAQPDPQPPSAPIEVPTTIEVRTPNADSADTQPDSDLSASGSSVDALLREPAGPSSANASDGGDDFKPSEEISEDFSISLPVDI
jgi:hypothetical protein